MRGAGGASDPTSLIRWIWLDGQEVLGCPEAVSLHVPRDWAEDIPNFLFKVQGRPSVPSQDSSSTLTPAEPSVTREARSSSPRWPQQTCVHTCTHTCLYTHAHFRQPPNP